MCFVLKKPEKALMVNICTELSHELCLLGITLVHIHDLGQIISFACVFTACIVTVVAKHSFSSYFKTFFSMMEVKLNADYMHMYLKMSYVVNVHVHTL